MRYLTFVLLIIITAEISAQSRRAATPVAGARQAAAPSDQSPERPVKAMFDEANIYAKTKEAEYDQKKVKKTDALLRQTLRERKQLAAKFAALAAARAELTPEDIYYLGMLHWIAENMDGTDESFRRYLALPKPAPERAQTARTMVVVASAKRSKLDDAETLLAEYLKATPTKLSEIGRMHIELAKSYSSQKEFIKAAGHAGEAYKAYKKVTTDPTSRGRGADELLDAGMLAFESYRAAGRQPEAESMLEDMRNTAAVLSSPTFYYYAFDQLIKYRIQTGRKPEAMETYAGALVLANKDFTVKAQANEVIQRLKKRERHYKMMGEPAPEFETFDQWFPGKPAKLADLRGKVVLLDFWATWCVPCLEAFPHIREWLQDHSKNGLVVLGVTRYYGMADGIPADTANEIEFLKRFKQQWQLPYDFVVMKDQRTQVAYGATALPTAVLIDRKGVIRYLESGTSPTRIEEMRAMIEQLIAEE